MNMIRRVLLLVLFCSPVHAGPVLLGTLDYYTSGGGAPETDPRLEFILELPANFFAAPSGLGAGRDLFVENRDLRIIYFNADNEPAFPSFASHATDGIEDQFTLWSLFPSSGGSGHLGTESQLFGVSPDLIGNTLDYVRLIVFDVRFAPWTPDPDVHPEIEGFKFLAFLRYEFYGTPVPEPESLSLFALCALVVHCRRLRG